MVKCRWLNMLGWVFMTNDWNVIWGGSVVSFDCVFSDSLIGTLRECVFENNLEIVFIFIERERHIE